MTASTTTRTDAATHAHGHAHNRFAIVAAAGNSGCGERPHSIPPANSPSVITVGGRCRYKFVVDGAR